MMYRPFDFFVIVIAVWVAVMPLYIFALSTDHITIENNYYDELQQCELDLKNTQPICPDVKCSGANSVLWFFVGMIWGSVIFLVIKQYLTDKKKKRKKKK